MINFAYAQASTQQPSMFASFIPLILIFLIFYFLLIRPQQKKQKSTKLLDNIIRGDEIMTSGGIIGKVIKTDGEKLSVEIAKNVNVTVFRSTVADVLNKKSNLLC